MLLDLTYRNKNHDRKINQILGKPFSLLQRWKMNGSGARRMIIEAVCPAFEHCLNAEQYPTFSSIELRPNGIIVYINKLGKVFAWLIPYYKLSIYSSKHFSIYADGMFVKYRLNPNKNHRDFKNKILIQKSKYMRDNGFDRIDEM